MVRTLKKSSFQDEIMETEPGRIEMEYKKLLKKKGGNKIVWGAALCTTGISILLVSYSLTYNSVTPRYIIPAGPIVAGMILFIAGIIQRNKFMGINESVDRIL